MATPTEKTVKAALDEVIDPCSAANGTNFSIVDMGLLEDIDIKGDHVTVAMHLTSPECMMIPHFMKEVTDKVGSLDGVGSVDLETDYGFEWTPSMMSEEAQEVRRERMRTRIQQFDGDLTVDHTVEELDAD